MQWLILITAIGLLLTKLADVISTLRHIRSTHHESNRMVRHIMQRMGVTPTIWLVFGISVIIIVVSTYVALSSHLFIQIGFVIYGIVIVLIQAAVAHNNWTHQENAITQVISRLLRRWYGS